MSELVQAVFILAWFVALGVWGWTGWRFLRRGPTLEGWTTHRRELDELRQHHNDLVERFGAFQKRELMRQARLEKVAGDDVAAQAAALIAASGPRGRHPDAIEHEDPNTPAARATLKDRLRKRVGINDLKA